MDHFSEFTEQDHDDTRFVTAVPVSGADERVRFEASIAEKGSRDDPEANWEPVISTLASHHLGDALQVDGARGVMSRDEAARALAESDDGHVHDEYTAHALLEYLASKGILRLDGEDVVIFMPHEDITASESAAMLNNLAATLDACVTRIDAVVSRIERDRETLERHYENVTDSGELQGRYEETVDEIKQEMVALLGGRKPSELPENEQAEFSHLRKRFQRYQTLAESMGESRLDRTPARRLAEAVEDYEQMKEALRKKSASIRVEALEQEVVKGGVHEQLENLTALVAGLSQTTAPAEETNEMSNDEFAAEFIDDPAIHEPEPEHEHGHEHGTQQVDELSDEPVTNLE